MPRATPLKSLVLVAILVTPRAAAGELAPKCGTPFGKKAVVRAIDHLCSAEGERRKGWSDEVWASNRLENEVKNDFCAPGPARTLTLPDFVELQRKAEALADAGTITYGDDQHLPADRASLRALGEGTQVRFIGFILGAHDAKPEFFTGGGESCNCNRRAKDWNDVHITLADSKDAAPCDGIVAELSPHFRPWLWNEDVLELAESRVVIVEGQLFFDSDHKPCSKGTFKRPKRASLWEIHPVYRLLVCRHGTMEQCPIGDAHAWVPLEDWVGE